MFGAIESSNIVGYQKVAMEQNKFYIVGFQFENIGSDGTMILGTDIVDGLPGVAYDDDGKWMTLAAQIQVPNTTGGYTTYRYLVDGYDKEKNDGTTAPGWCDDYGNLVKEVELVSMVGAWVKSTPDSADFMSKGMVSSADIKEIDCPVGFDLRASAFPVPIVLNSSKMIEKDIIGAVYDEAGAWLATTPQIQVISADGGYKTYRYLVDGYDKEKNDGTTAPGWCDDYGNLVTDDVIGSSVGFWTKGVTGEFTLKFSK